MSQMVKRALVFVAVFTFAMLCAVILTFCSGAKFGTGDFGWLIATGMVIGTVLGALTATLPDEF